MVPFFSVNDQLSGEVTIFLKSFFCKGICNEGVK